MIKRETGNKREFSTGAKRQNADKKPRPGLFPGDAYLAISQHFADGAAVYDDRNWEKGLPLNSIIDSLERHIAQEKMGLTDESHDLALAWNAVVYLATKLRIKAGILPAELDDMPKYRKRGVVEETFTEPDKFFVGTNYEEDQDISQPRDSGC